MRFAPGLAPFQSTLNVSGEPFGGRIRLRRHCNDLSEKLVFGPYRRQWHGGCTGRIEHEIGPETIQKYGQDREIVIHEQDKNGVT